MYIAPGDFFIPGSPRYTLVFCALRIITVALITTFFWGEKGHSTIFSALSNRSVALSAHLSPQ